MKLLLTAWFFFSFQLLQAQQLYSLSEKNGDCMHAIEIRDTVFGPTSAPLGPGKELEIWGNDKKDSMYVEQEHHSVWYTFKALQTGTLSFDIIPQNPGDDYDFLLFRDATGDFCSDAREKKIKPLRSNIARNDKRIKSLTGVSSKGTRAFVHSGPGNSYSRTISVIKDEVYYLFLDNVYEKGEGHSIRFHYRAEKPKLEAGQRIRFSNIQFHANSAVILPVSKPDLDSILILMRDNPGLQIEVQGHVNWPSKPNDPELQDLSERRAKAIRTFLIENGIASERVRWKGFGNTQMLFPQAVTEKEAQMNRRVEILVL